MWIKSSKEPKVQRIIEPKAKEIDFNEASLRPKNLWDYVGQELLKKHLSVSIASAKVRNTSLEHLLFYWPPGLWKTTLSNIIALEMWSNLKITSGPAIEKQSDLVSILSNIETWDILFIDEIHRLKPQIEEVLYTAMEDFAIDIIVWKWTWAQWVRMPVNNFTLIWATTKLSSLSSPLRDRFWNVMKLDFYNAMELESIVFRNSKLLNLDISQELVEAISCRSRGTPRIANALLRRVRDFAQIKGNGKIDIEIARFALKALNVDAHGLDEMDNKILSTIIDKFKGGPVGITTLATAVAENAETLEEVYEPFLIQEGFLMRTPRGREATDKAYKHLGRLKLGNQGELF